MKGPPDSDKPTSELLLEMRAGSPGAEGQLFERLSREFRGLAKGRLRGHHAPTLQTTALMHEAWLRLAPCEREFEGREHFLAVAARAMRSVLVDYARSGASAKRGGEHARVPLEVVVAAYEERSFHMVELDDALEQLAARQPRQAKVVELRFFGGLSIPETALALETSTATVERDWRIARVWLLDALGKDSA